MEIITLTEHLQLVNNVLDADEYTEFLTECVQGNLFFQQQYPGRAFTEARHEEWLLSYFSKLSKINGERELQQIFLGLELPGSEMLLHRSHPNIGSVMIYNLDNSPVTNLRTVESSDPTVNYINNQVADGLPGATERYQFAANTAYVLRNSAQAPLWGFSGGISPNYVKRSVWIYLS